MKEKAVVKPGDILLFKAPTTTDIISSNASLSLIMSGQVLSALARRSKGGHYDTTHAAICTSYDENSTPVITHFTGAVNGSESVKLNDYMGDSDRSYLIFSPKDQPLREKIVEEALDKRYHSQKYSYIGTALSLFSLNKKMTRDKREEATFCSAFVAKVLRFIGINLGLSKDCTPKSLEAALRKSDKFDKKHHLGKGGTQKIVDELNNEIDRLSIGNDNAKSKAKSVKEILDKVLSSTKYKELDEESKAIEVLKHTLPLLALHTTKGIHLMKPNSYRKIKKLAIRKGFASGEVIEQTQVDTETKQVLKKSRAAPKLRQKNLLIGSK